jgi:hypothetical protein
MKSIDDKIVILEATQAPLQARLRDLEAIVFKTNATHRRLLFKEMDDSI